MSCLSVKLLGEFSLAYADTPITSVRTERLQALLAYLLLHRDTALPRQQIATCLWPDVSEPEAKANLRRRLHELRQWLPEADRFLQVNPKTLHWVSEAPFSLDVVEFEKALATAHQAQQDQNVSLAERELIRATELYRGSLLPNCYDDWVEGPRERLEQLAITALDQLITLLANQGSWQVAIGYAQQLLRLNPLSETAYCHLMRLHGQSGDRASALRVYHQCMTLLQEELGITPSPTTCKLYEQLLTMAEDPSSTSQSPAALDQCPHDHGKITPLAAKEFPSFSPARVITATTPLIGRESEWTTIQSWKQAQHNTNLTELLLLTGEPGIGKTRLLEELTHQVQAEGGHILWGQGFEAEILRPYGVWIDAFRTSQSNDLTAEMTALLLHPKATESKGQDRSRLLEAGVQFIQTLVTDRQPLLIVLDDIQWLDEASVAFLHYAIRLLSQWPVLFALAARKQELQGNLAVCKFLQAMHREHHLQRLELAPLDQVHTAELAHLINQNIDGDQVFLDSGGNPLFALEVARALATTPASRILEPFAGDLTTLIQGRLFPLDDSTRQLVSWAAALGRSFNPTSLAQVVNCPPPQLITALEQLEQYGIIRPGNTLNGEICYDFAHDIVRQVAYQQLSEPRRRLVHTHIAQALNQNLATHPAAVSNVAYHASLGGDHALAAAASLEAAERHLKLFAYTEAAEVARQGIQHCQYLETSSQLSLQLRLLRTFVKAGVPKDQVMSLETELQRLIEQATVVGLKEAEAIGREALMVLSYDHGRLAQAHQHSLQAAERSRLASPATTAYMLVRTGSCLAEIGKEMARAEALLLEAQSLAERVGLQTIDIPAGLGCIHRYQGNVESARNWLEQGWKQAQLEQDHWRECYCQHPVLVEFSYDSLMPPAAYAQAKQNAMPCLGEANVQVLFTLMSPQGDRSICVFEAASAEDVRSALRKLGMPFKRVLRSQLILPSHN